MEKYYERQKQLQKEVNKLEKKKTTKNILKQWINELLSI